MNWLVQGGYVNSNDFVKLAVAFLAFVLMLIIIVSVKGNLERDQLRQIIDEQNGVIHTLLKNQEKVTEILKSHNNVMKEAIPAK